MPVNGPWNYENISKTEKKEGIMRYSQRDVIAVTKRLASVMEVPYGHYVRGEDGRPYVVAGAIEECGAYGGWDLQQQCEEGGVHSLLRGFFPAREYCERVNAMITGICIGRRKES
jgi:hypothetical protein